jgi:hypothetical protein
VTGHEVVIVAYDPEWPGRANALIDTLANALGRAARLTRRNGEVSIAPQQDETRSPAGLDPSPLD